MTGVEPQSLADGGQELPAEESARANLYALVGRLFFDAPDDVLIATLTQGATTTESPSTPIERAWRKLQDACRTAFPVVLKQEFDTLFGGVGRREVTPYTSHFVKNTPPDRHLVLLRQQIAGWNLVRRAATFETEDHVSGLCDVMRLLIGGEHPYKVQRLFFNEFVWAGIVPFLEAVERSPNANFYKCVAQFSMEFLRVEKEAMEMPDD